MSPFSRARTSQLLGALADTAPERISLGTVADALADRSFGIVVLCMALPNAIPGPYIPGFSAIFALPILWLALQLAFGRRRPRLPGLVRRISFRRQRFVRFVERATPLLIRLEQWLQPRPSWLTSRAGLRCLGLLLFVFGIVLALPVPLANVPIALAISILALGLIEEDSRALTVGIAAGVVGCLWQLLLVTAGIEALGELHAYLG